MRVLRIEAYMSEIALAVVEEGGKASQLLKKIFQLPTKPFHERERGGSVLILEES